jgi:hypothetical protein
MKIDRVVITTFTGYFFITVLCLQSIKKYLAHLPIDIVIDDYDLTHWPTYVADCKQYLVDQFPDLDINFVLFSQLPHVDDAKHGGWFRQQLIKLHLDQLISADHWLSVDADVVFKEYPATNIIPVTRTTADAIDTGNRKYVKYMLAVERPYLGHDTEHLCASGVPFRYLSRDLLKYLRQHVEQIHNKNFLQLHIDLMNAGEIVAYDPDHQRMVMSEFQLIEIYRDQFCKDKFNIQVGTSAFDHDSVKDWHRDRAWFESQGVPVNDQHWQLSQQVGQHHV